MPLSFTYTPVPNSGRGRRIPLWLFFFFGCTLLGVVSYTRHYFEMSQLGMGTQLWRGLLIWLACFYPWVLLGPLVFQIEKRLKILQDFPVWKLGVFALASFAFAWLSAELTIALVTATKSLLRESPLAPNYTWSVSLNEFLVQQFLFWLTVASSFIVGRITQLYHKEREANLLALERAHLESSLRQAELEALRTRLNPHFLFNSLQNISVLAQHEPKTASRMLASLGDILRASFRRDLPAEITLASELDLTRAYLEVEQMRFRERLSVCIDMAIGTERALVPSLLLQPLVENAIIHGLRGVSKGRVGIRSRREDDRLMISITDNGTGLVGNGLQESKVGVGLNSTCK